MRRGYPSEREGNTTKEEATLKGKRKGGAKKRLKIAPQKKKERQKRISWGGVRKRKKGDTEDRTKRIANVC